MKLILSYESAMASLEPPVPANAVDTFAAQPESIASGKEPSGRFGRWRRTVGLLMLALVVFLWTASNFLASVNFHTLLC